MWRKPRRWPYGTAHIAPGSWSHFPAHQSTSSATVAENHWVHGMSWGCWPASHSSCSRTCMMDRGSAWPQQHDCHLTKTSLATVLLNVCLSPETWTQNQPTIGHTSLKETSQSLSVRFFHQMPSIPEETVTQSCQKQTWVCFP